MNVVEWYFIVCGIVVFGMVFFYRMWGSPKNMLHIENGRLYYIEVNSNQVSLRFGGYSGVWTQLWPLKGFGRKFFDHWPCYPIWYRIGHKLGYGMANLLYRVRSAITNES